MKPNYTWLLIGIALGLFVVPPLIATVRSKAAGA